MKRQIYLGWDPREETAYNVARASIAHRTKQPVSITPLKLKHVGDILKRPIDARGDQLWCPISDAPMSTEFAISRFCIPFIEQTGWALFADCDIVCWSDVDELFQLANPEYAVMVVKHRQESGDTRKMDGQLQTFYQRKNWSSVVLWNCDHPANKRFTIQNLNEWPGRDLHAFKWLDDTEIGSLPVHWNWLVNVSGTEAVKRGIWHYTLGGPWFKNWQPARFDIDWLQEENRVARRVA